MFDNMKRKTDNRTKKQKRNNYIVMTSLPFKVESITVVNTGLTDTSVESIVWIDERRIEITNPVDCVYDDGFGGTTVGRNTEFDWSFTERDMFHDAYVLIVLSNE